MAAPSWAHALPTVTCSGTLGPGVIDANVTAEAGCDLAENTTVEGNVNVVEGGSLNDSPGLIVRGHLWSHGATHVEVYISLIGKSVVIEHTTAGVLLTGGGSIDGLVRIENNAMMFMGYGNQGIEVYDLTLGSRLLVTKNDVESQEPSAQPQLVVDGTSVAGEVRINKNTLSANAMTSLPAIEAYRVKTGGNLSVNSNNLELDYTGRSGDDYAIIRAAANEVGGRLSVSDNNFVSEDSPYDHGWFRIEENKVTNRLACRHDVGVTETTVEMNTAGSDAGLC